MECEGIERVYCVRPGENPCSASTTQAPRLSTLTVYKILCPSYSVVPANKDACGFDATGGHCGELDYSYQTDTANPMTDIPSACSQAGVGWAFRLTQNGVTETMYTQSNGAFSVTINGTEIGVSEVIQGNIASFGQLRCYKDMLYGDNADNVYVPPAGTHVYCLAYNVVKSK